jgi:hypothetical protein
MKLLKTTVVILLFLVNLLIIQPAWADPIAEKSPEYSEITQTLDTLIKGRNDPDKQGYTAEQLAQKIRDLQFQKYAMESTEDWGICRNETDQTIGIYAHDPDKSKVSTQSSLYYLESGKETDDDWDCDGVYIPGEQPIAGVPLIGPVAAKIVDGTRLVIGKNPTTGELEFNAPISQFFKDGESQWSVPNLSLSDIAAQAPNAPND